MKILNKKDSLILRVRKTNQLICLGWYYVNCENLLCLSLANRYKLSSCGPEEVSWFVKKWSYHRTGGIISRILLEWEKDEGRVWHLVTCNLCTATFGVTSDNTRVTSRNPWVRHHQRWIRGKRGRAYAGLCPSPMVSNVTINNLIWNNVRTTLSHRHHQSFTSVVVC